MRNHCGLAAADRRRAGIGGCASASKTTLPESMTVWSNNLTLLLFNRSIAGRVRFLSAFERASDKLVAAADELRQFI